MEINPFPTFIHFLMFHITFVMASVFWNVTAPGTIFILLFEDDADPSRFSADEAVDEPGSFHGIGPATAPPPAFCQGSHGEKGIEKKSTRF